MDTLYADDICRLLTMIPLSSSIPARFASYFLAQWCTSWTIGLTKTIRRRKTMALSALKQLFLMLVKLKLNLGVLDLALRFGVSRSLVSKYMYTCTVYGCVFFYEHLKSWAEHQHLNRSLQHFHVLFKRNILQPMSLIIAASKKSVATPYVQYNTWNS